MRAMVDRPVIFSAPMVRALLEGRKTQTRRLAWREVRENQILSEAEMSALERKGWQPFDGADEYTDIGKPSPWQRVQPGDRLWVREAHHRSDDDGTPLIGYDFADDPTFGPDRIEQRPGIGPVHLFRYSLGGWGGRTSRNFPSIHMPRWASRLTLTVTAVRVERLQEISDDDAAAEGVSDEWADTEVYGQSQPYRYGFSALWNSLHGPGAWDANPEVVAISFDLRKGNIDA
jgi:hypothetical protein